MAALCDIRQLPPFAACALRSCDPILTGRGLHCRSVGSLPSLSHGDDSFPACLIYSNRHGGLHMRRVVADACTATPL